MKVIILPHDKAVAKYAYKLVMDRMSNGINAIGLPCGRAPLKLYGESSEGRPIDFSAFDSAYAALTAKLRPQVFEYGFLKT